MMDAWAQLVSTTNIFVEPVRITKQKFVIGRAQDTDLCLPENRLVSGHHCVIERDSLGNVWLQDISTNGTFLNSTNKISGKRVLLKHGDEVFIVYRNADSDLNVAFLFQDLEELRREELETTDEANGESDETQPYEENENIKPEDEKKEGIPTIKRPLGSAVGDCDEEPAAKLVKFSKSENVCRERSAVSNSKMTCRPQMKDEQEMKLQITSSTSRRDLHNQLIAEVDHHEKQATSAERPPVENAVVDSKLQMLDDTSVLEATTSSGITASSNKTSDVPELLEEQLNCAICQEILYNSISLQPCMHIFCAGCYSDWMDRSTDCPTCRKAVTRIKKYHPMKNVIEAYLTACPEKQRPEEDRKKLDAADKITKDNMKPYLPTRPVGEYDDEEDDVSDEYVEEEDMDYVPPAAVAVIPNFRPQRTICRQCPDYQGPRPAWGSTGASPAVTLTSVASSNEASSSKADTLNVTTGPSAKTYPAPPAFICSANQTHIICLCCLQPMPHRWNEVNAAQPGVVPSQQCVICSRAFCHVYWGCFGQCDGCLAKFADMKFRPEVLNNLILANTHESKGFRLYLASKDLTVEDVHRACVQKLYEGVYSCADEAFLLETDFSVCYNCALRNLAQLAFEYRRDIPEIDMPVEFRGRPNCRWGWHCRTQTHNQRHAETYNHICEESRPCH